MTMITDTTPEPASPPALGTPRASLEVAREIAAELAWAIEVEARVIADSLSIGADHQALYAWKQLRIIGVAMAKAMAALAVPQPGPDGAVVPDVKNGRLN